MVLQYMQYILVILFLYINTRIILWDYKNSIIKNKFLLYLLCIFWVSIIIAWTSILPFIIYTLVTFIVSLLLSTFRIWWAGDAKYFFILYLFILQLHPLIYVWNIVVATFIFLLFLFLKNIIFTNKNWIWLWYIIAWDVKRWKSNTEDKFKKSHILWLMWALNIINEFFLFFLLIKALKELFFMFAPWESMSWISTYMNPYFIFLGIFILLIVAVRKYIEILKNKIIRKTWINKIELTAMINLFFITFLWIILYITYKDASIFLNDMYKILTIFLLTHVAIRIILYIYKKCFIEMEKSIIHVDDLKSWDYIDKNWFKWRISTLLDKKEIKTKQKISYYTQTPDDIKEIKRLVKHYYKKEPYVSIINSFPYSPVIFLGFLLTYMHQGSYLAMLFNYITNYIS